jgi:pimeloyl-ACP methyl ester carboxylesterase
MRSAVRGPAAVALAVLLAPGLAACSEDEKAPRREALEFGECGERVDTAVVPPERAAALTFTCATLDVPLFHAEPDGEQLPMAVVRVRDARQHDRIGSIVLNPGGPGNPGLGWIAGWAARMPDEVLERFDLVSFDPRGTGLSQGINCADLPTTGEPTRRIDLTVEADYQYALDLSRQGSESCAEAIGTDRVPAFSTTATAADLDVLRSALGDEQLTYVGFSYGAKLGAAYAHQFPDRVRALVLDAPSDPRSDWLGLMVRQIEGFERAFEEYADDCPNRPTCARLGDPRAALATLVDRADGMPVPSGRPTGDVPMSGIDVLQGTTGLLFASNLWPLLDDGLGEALLGDSGTLHEAIDQTTHRVADGDGPDASEALAVINCTDEAGAATRAEVLAAARAMGRRSPTYAPLGSWWLMACQGWVPDRVPLEQPTAPDAPPLLVVGTRHDPATPYPGAVSLAETLGSGHLLTWEGYGHTAYLRESPCVDEIVDAYLLELTVPEDGALCPA